jgi:integrating conjugative element protein (TIGR03757 family)
VPALPMLSLSKHSHLLASVAVAVLLTANGVVMAGEHPTVEVFTATDSPTDTDVKADRVEVYEIDGIERFEAELSRGLPANADAAKRSAQARIGQLNQRQLQRAQRAAQGLAKAMQYGIDRYPAIVLDGRAVVYGVPDVKTALHLYRQWQEAAGP